MNLPRDRIALPALGAIAVVLAWATRGGAIGAICWGLAAVVGAAGYGFGIERLVRARLAIGLAIVSGLAGVIVVSTGLAHLGMFSEWVVFGIVIGGVGLSALARPAVAGRGVVDGDGAGGVIEGNARLDRGFAWWFGGVAGLLLIATDLARRTTPTTDGFQHVFAIRQLLDGGVLDAWSSAGGHLVAESIFTWGGGAQVASMFEAVCAALAIMVIANELSANDRVEARLVFGVLVVVIVIEPTTTLQPAATLFHLAAIRSLAHAPTGRIAWPTLVLALALASLRHELCFLALPYAAAAIIVPRITSPTRNVVAVCAIAWLVATFAIQQLLGLGVANAVAKSFMLLGAFPLTALLLRLLGTYRWRSEVGVACFAGATFVLALATYAIPPVQHSGVVTIATWFGIAFAILSLVGRAGARTEPQLHVGAASFVVAFLVTGTLIKPPFDVADWERLRSRFRSSVVAIRERAVFGADREHEMVRKAQELAPAGVRIAFWGRSAALLDFGRNALRDISTYRGQALVTIRASQLDGIDFLLLEDLPKARWERRVRDYVYIEAIGEVEDLLEAVGSVGTTRLFRVR